MNRMRTMLVAIAVAATASLAFAQNADKNSAGPTKNDYRLRVIEPREGATVAGDVVRVVVDTRIPAEVGSEKVDVNTMPRPMIDVFLDEHSLLRAIGQIHDAHQLFMVDERETDERTRREVLVL